MPREPFKSTKKKEGGVRTVEPFGWCSYRYVDWNSESNIVCSFYFGHPISMLCRCQKPSEKFIPHCHKLKAKTKNKKTPLEGKAT